MGAKWITRFGVFAVLALVLHPIFFAMFRMMVFETVPRDDYEPLLLWLLSEPGGQLLSSPYPYRILSYGAAVPFYYLLPTIDLSGLPESLPLPQLRATAAMAALSYASLIGACVVIYAVAVDRLNFSRLEGFAAAVALFVLAWHSSIIGIDPTAILLVSVGLILVHRPYLFSVFLVITVGFNEKIALVFAIWLAVRLLFVGDDRRQLGVQTVAALASLGLYAAAVMLIDLPGNEYQLEFSQYTATALQNLEAYLTPRGLLLNVLPVATLVGALLLAWRQIGSAGVRRQVIWNR